MDRKHWWYERAVGGIMTYWIYQHIGNLSPRDLDEENEIYAKVRGNPTPPGISAFTIVGSLKSMATSLWLIGASPALLLPQGEKEFRVIAVARHYCALSGNPRAVLAARTRLTNSAR